MTSGSPAGLLPAREQRQPDPLNGPARATGPRQDSRGCRRSPQHQTAGLAIFAGLWWGSVALLALSMHPAVVGDGVGVGGCWGVGVGVGRVSAAAGGATKGGAMTEVMVHSGSGPPDVPRF